MRIRLIVKIPSNSSLPIKCKNMSRHKMTSSFGFKEFEGTQEESEYWNKSREEERSSLKKRHVETGECLLCIIDELSPQRKKPEKQTEQASPKVQLEPIARKIIGGLIPLAHEKVEVSTQNLKVSWIWHNDAAGIVSWTFQNTGQAQASCILFRNSYYFGNAYWVIYENNPSFACPFATKLEPLVDNTVQKNSAPIGIISWKQEDGSYKSIVAFIFTLAPGQTWQMLEGGFSIATPPTDVAAYQVSQISEEDYCIGYDKQQIISWDKQTGSKLQGYSPNPNTFHSVQVLAPSEAKFIQLFNDSIQKGKCESVATEAPVVEASTNSQGESRFWGLLAKNAGTLN